MPISDCEVRDPRVRRTRQSLQAALRAHLESRNFDEISVQDITEAAAVNRATFYDHYADKFALLDSMVAGGFHQLLHERQVKLDGACPSAARAIIEVACDYMVLMHTGHAACGAQRSFEPFADAAITTAIGRVLMRGRGDCPGINQVAASAASWAIYGAVKQWFQTPNRPPVTEIVPEILSLVLPILAQAFAPEPVSLLAASGLRA